MARVNILKQIRGEEGWKLVSIPHNHHDRYNWKALPEGRYFIEWWERGKRQAAGATTADPLEAAGRCKHVLEGQARAHDCALIVTDHSTVDYDLVVGESSLVVDTRNATAHVTHHREKIGRC